MTKQEESLFWADQIARKVIKDFPKEKIQTCAAGITPSGTIHIGHFREMITVDLIIRALQGAGKKTRYIYSWDDYDRLRKIPKNVPDAKALEKYLYKPVTDTPDPWGCHSSYAEHFEKEAEDAVSCVGINPEFLHQSKMYRKSVYADDIKESLQKRHEIRKILDKYRKEKLADTWYPLNVYCEKCGYEQGKVVEYDDDYKVKYKCVCGHEAWLDVRESGNVKLPWRVDWPMRWRYENVTCEGGGKEHNTPGGSLDTGHELCQKIFNKKPPVRFMYDYIIVKGAGGKMSSSLGNVITLKDALEIYLPEIIRFIFAGTKPVKEFSISFGEDVLKVYEDFYKTERIYYGKEEASDRDKKHWSRVYEMSAIKKPAKTMPTQPSFRHAVTLINVYGNVEKALESFGVLKENDKKRHESVLMCAKFWVEKHAPEKYKFSLQEEMNTNVKLSKDQKTALKQLALELKKSKVTEEGLKNMFFEIANENNIKPQELFQGAYNVLLGKNQGPRLATFILAVGRKKIAELLEKI
ncbi:MAG: lysine--tRNA ligase [Candidatus Aenigmatarchaeota archaeon]